jgi:signal transduction histidine kinase
MVGLLLLAFIVVLALGRKVQQRGTALTEEVSNRRMAEARADERTRMAEELHDTLAQGLTGVALQLGAADLARQQQSPALGRHLTLAGKSSIRHATKSAAPSGACARVC